MHAAPPSGRCRRLLARWATGARLAPLAALVARLALLPVPLGLAACAVAPVGTSLVDTLQRPAERQLAAGLRAYEDARYGDAETALTEALRVGLAHARDQAAAHKTLAFIYCTSQRASQCAAAFRAARAADPGFALNRAEAGHPQWGPVYQATRR